MVRLSAVKRLVIEDDGQDLIEYALLSAFIALAASLTQPAAKLSSTSLAVAVAVPACPANTIFSASFTGGQEASPEAKQQWEDFRQSLTPAGYDTVTISGTFGSASNCAQSAGRGHSGSASASVFDRAGS